MTSSPSLGSNNSNSELSVLLKATCCLLSFPLCQVHMADASFISDGLAFEDLGEAAFWLS